MRLFILGLTLMLSACAGKHTIDNYHPHMFSQDQNFIMSSLKCEDVYQTDEYNTADNEVFRCSADKGNVFLKLESNGNNSENLKSATLIWKQWRSELNYKESRTKAQQFTAVLAKLYAPDLELKLVDAFFNSEPYIFNSPLYSIKTTSNVKRFYTIRKATVTFK